MSRNKLLGVGMGLIVFFAGSGCEIHTCEEGAKCAGRDDELDLRGNEPGDQQVQCIGYCARVNVCGGPRADDLDACVAACRGRFSVLPEETAKLCACAAHSSCSDVVEGRCSERPTSAGGSTGAGGDTSGAGGVPTGAGGSVSPGAGGSSSTVPDAGSSGGQSSGGSGAECSRDCDCPAPENCVAGFCTA
jgi:hypothetical protein